MSFRFFVIFAMLMLVGAFDASGQVMLQKAVVSAGGSIATNGTQAAGMTAGQAVTGTATNGQTVAHFGFWNAAQAASSVPTAPTLSVSMQAYPNPTSDQMTVSLTLANAGNLDLELYDVTGKQVLVISSGGASSTMHPAGTFDLPVDLSGLASGSYILAARLPGQLLEQSIVVVR
jgi:hypothetical protein